MVVQHNLTAMNSNRMLGITTKAQAKSTEKLSSGYKINRAADDAAGLAISEKMRRQIRGLTQASANAQDGISAVQTAEGALTEVHDMLQRMNELATKSANGTNSQEERDYIQSEVDALIDEIDRVSETTKFNELYLLKGDGTETKEVADPIEGQEAVAVKAEYINNVTGVPALKAGETAPTWYLKGSATQIATADITKYLEVNEDGDVVIKDGYEIFDAAADTSGEFGSQKKANIVDNTKVQALYESTDGRLATAAAGTTKVDADDLKDYFNEDGSYKGGLFAKETNKTTYKEIGAEQIEKFVKVTPGQAAVTADPDHKKEVTVTKALEFKLQVGADGTDRNMISVSINSMSAEGIGVKGLKVGEQDDARKAIDSLKNSIKVVSEQRSALGAIQNRLEHTINNLDNVVENTTSAESQIRDTDMATEMVRYANNNILAQAGQAMLAQSNQANQGVLSLLG